MAMRAQLSLIFEDEELYNSFIIPYKENRLLNNVIIKCLSSYYYDEEIRNRIEGITLEEVVEETVTSTQELCDNIRASLLMQDFLASELQSTLANGTEDVENILQQTNKFAEQSGVAKTAQSEYSSEILQISDGGRDLPKPPTGVSSNSAFNILVNAVIKLAMSMGNTEVVALLSEDKISKLEADSKNESYFSSSDSYLSDKNSSQKIAEESLTGIATTEEEPSNQEVNEVEETDNSDAKDAMQEFLASLN